MEYARGRIGEDLLYGTPINDSRRHGGRPGFATQAVVAGTLLATVAGILGYAHCNAADRLETPGTTQIEQSYGGR